MPSSCLIFRTSQIDSNRTLINYGETPILVLVKGIENTGEQIKYYGGLEFTSASCDVCWATRIECRIYESFIS